VENIQIKVCGKPNSGKSAIMQEINTHLKNRGFNASILYGAYDKVESRTEEQHNLIIDSLIKSKLKIDVQEMQIHRDGII